MLNSFNRRFPVALVYILFGFSFIGLGLIDSFLDLYLFFYYQTEIGVSLIIVGMTSLVVTIIILLIQPFLGFLSDRNYSFTRKLGRHFPWITVSGFLTAIMFVILFILPIGEPSTNGILIFIAYLTYSCSFAIFTINLFASLLTRFRYPKERLLLASISQILSVISVIIFMIFGSLLIDYGLPSSYQSTAINMAIVFIVCLMISFPGIIEEPGVIERYFKPYNAPKNSFLDDYFRKYRIFKNKNFLLLITQFIVILISNYLLTSGMVYYIYFVLELSGLFYSIIYNGYIIWFMIGTLGGFLLSWFLGHLKTYIISGFLLGSSLILFTFIIRFEIAVLIMDIVGFGYGLNNLSIIPLMGDAFDDNSQTLLKRSDGFAYGTLLTFEMLGAFISSFLTIFILISTGFDPISPIQTPLALWGIRFLFALIPGILVLIGTLIFTFTYDLKPERTEIIRMQLNELQI